MWEFNEGGVLLKLAKITGTDSAISANPAILSKTISAANLSEVTVE